MKDTEQHCQQQFLHCNNGRAYTVLGLDEPDIYAVVESNLETYQDHGSDRNTMPDGNMWDLGTMVNDRLGIMLPVAASRSDTGSIFIDTAMSTGAEWISPKGSKLIFEVIKSVDMKMKCIGWGCFGKKGCCSM